MRQVVGKATTELGADEFAARRNRYADLAVDIGTGDGKHVLTLARARPQTLVVGLDAGPDAMRKTAARAAAKPARGGVPNALFVWASIEQWPAELTGITALHALMPWGSLLRALAGPEVEVLAALARRCLPGAELLVTLNLHAWRPPVPEVGDAPEPTPGSERLIEDYARAGWRLDSVEHPEADELARLGTSWTKRLGASRAQLDALALRGARA